MVCQFISNRNPSFREYIDYRTISVEVQPDELACLSKDGNLTNCSTNIYLIVFKNIATGFILSAVDRMRNRVESSINDGDTRLDPIQLPTYMTDAFTDLNSRNLNVDPDKLRTFGDFGTNLNPLKRQLEGLDELEKQSKAKCARTEESIQQEECELSSEPPLPASSTPVLDDVTTVGVDEKQDESQQKPCEFRPITPDTRQSSSFSFDGYAVGDGRLIVDSPMSIQENDTVIHLNEAEFVNDNVGIDSFFEQFNAASANSISKNEGNDSFYDEEQEEDEI